MLTDKALQALKPKAKLYRVADNSGLSLFIEVTPAGGKHWRLRYRAGGKQKMMALGSYPDVKAAEARRRAAEARELHEQGVDPSAQRRVDKQLKAIGSENTFEAVSILWRRHVSGSLADITKSKHEALFTNDIIPIIGHMPIATIKPTDALVVVHRIVKRGALDIGKRVFNVMGRVFRYGVANGLCEIDPTRHLEVADIIPSRATKHHAAILDTKKLGEFLRAADDYGGAYSVRCALQLMPMVFVRPGELRAAKWADFDLKAAEWRYTVTKTDTDHIVPLSKQAVAILNELRKLTGHQEYVFPNEQHRGRCLSENTLVAAMRRMGFGQSEVSAHGFRATARTHLDETLGFRPDFIEHQLAHAVRDANGRAYNRTSHLKERKAMMQRYSDWLDSLKAGR